MARSPKQSLSLKLGNGGKPEMVRKSENRRERVEVEERTRAQLMFYHRQHHGQPIAGSPTFASSFQENLDLNSPIPSRMISASTLRYLSPPSASSVVMSPLSAVENLMERSPSAALFKTPVKAMEGEEVLVMDAIPVRAGGGKISARGSASGSSSLSSSSSSGSASGKSRFKTEMCHAWEESGNCRHRSKCQFAYSIEELRPHRLIVKNKSEVIIDVIAAMASKPAQSIEETPSPATPKNTSKALLTTSVKSKDWSPLDDGIEVPSRLRSRNKVTAYISRILAGPAPSSRRLPVFVEICSP